MMIRMVGSAKSRTSLSQLKLFVISTLRYQCASCLRARTRSGNPIPVRLAPCSASHRPEAAVQCNPTLTAPSEIEHMDTAYPTTEEALARGWFVDATSDDIDFSTPDGSPLNRYPPRE